MTWPLTFSSPPSVEFHRRKGVTGALKAGKREKEVGRGSYSADKLMTNFAHDELGRHTARVMREDNMTAVLKVINIEQKETRKGR